MFGALWAGAYVLSFFGVSIDAVRIAGGTVVALSGWQLLTSGDRHAERKDRDRQAAARDPERDPLQMAFFPLTLPFTTGPGTIAVAITLGAERPANGLGLLGVLCRRRASPPSPTRRSSGSPIASPTGSPISSARRRALVVVRLTAFLLMCIGVQILLSAMGDLVAKWRASDGCSRAR